MSCEVGGDVATLSAVFVLIPSELRRFASQLLAVDVVVGVAHSGPDDWATGVLDVDAGV